MTVAALLRATVLQMQWPRAQTFACAVTPVTLAPALSAAATRTIRVHRPARTQLALHRTHPEPLPGDASENAITERATLVVRHPLITGGARHKAVMG